MKKTFPITNAVHGTHAQVRLNMVGDTVLKAHTVTRLRKVLCPVAADCPCKADTLFGKGDFASAVWNGETGEVVVTRVAPPVAPAAAPAPAYSADMEATPAPVEAAPVAADAPAAAPADAQPV